MINISLSRITLYTNLSNCDFIELTVAEMANPHGSGLCTLVMTTGKNEGLKYIKDNLNTKPDLII